MDPCPAADGELGESIDEDACSGEDVEALTRIHTLYAVAESKGTAELAQLRIFSLRLYT